jgi:hypothetical protein
VAVGRTAVSVAAIVGINVGSVVSSGSMVFVGCCIGSVDDNVVLQADKINDINKKANIIDLIGFFIYSTP